MSEKNEREPDSTDPAQLVLMPDGTVWEHITRHERRPPVEPRARKSDPETSHEAAASMVGGAASQRAEILRVLGWCRRGRQLCEADDRFRDILTPGQIVDGMTADELDEHIGWRATTAGRRLIELQRLGLVRRTTEKRKTRSGRAAFVWVAV